MLPHEMFNQFLGTTSAQSELIQHPTLVFQYRQIAVIHWKLPNSDEKCGFEQQKGTSS